MPTLDVTLTIVPEPRSRIWDTTARVTPITPKVFVSKTCRITSSGVASSAEKRPIPALLTRTSICPNRAIPSATALATLVGSVTSSAVTSSRSLASNSVGLGDRMVAITFQPRARNIAALALPKPEEHPVIRTVEVMCFSMARKTSPFDSDVL
jgi:hypothetical protein